MSQELKLRDVCPYCQNRAADKLRAENSSLRSEAERLKENVAMLSMGAE